MLSSARENALFLKKSSVVVEANHEKSGMEAADTEIHGRGLRPNTKERETKGGGRRRCVGAGAAVWMGEACRTAGAAKPPAAFQPVVGLSLSSRASG